MEKKLKVLHVITKLELGGAQKVTLMTLERLPKSRYEVGLVSGPEGLLRERAESIPDVEVTWVPHLAREIHPWKDLRAFFQLYRIFRRQRPDIVHTHSSKAGILGRWAAWAAGVRVIFHTAHGFGFNDYQGRLGHSAYVWLERLARPITTQPVVVSRANAARAEQLGILRPGEWILCRDAIAIEEFTAPGPRKRMLAAWGVPPETTVVGMVACLKPQKSPLDFVEVASCVIRDRTDVHFVLAGDGELRPMVEARIRELGIGDHVTLLGWQSDMPEVYRNFDLFLLTSLWEGQPCVFAEAMANRLPIVATEADGAREAIEDGVTGFVCPPRDVPALAGAVLRLVADTGLRKSMGAEARNRVAEFDIATSVSRLECAYRRYPGGPVERSAAAT
jgi:glycosyltransferase involved in cell wall biosynthesis